ncbi:hypothetical protein SCOR_01425 [Sulfidibacter corallicola]|uniref:6-bladed beta-propeller n=1 Tax=Sulfidibacter corallicola TaxID=2818388 RepID=A0A8A4TI29_SULCO|nr:6-bladed beta-propeller [Sulfidibacter corallicola]QTD48812.1 hypothetical protein J3U87_24790 [Sulfidibacter corallicola]
MTLILLVGMLAIDATHFTETGVYQPLRLSEALVSEDGSLYVLAFPEATIRFYGPDGTLRKTIGGKGEGPGEFIYPDQMWVQDRQLYVFDVNNGQISLFDEKGKFVKRWSAPNRGLELIKVRSGWVYGTWQNFGEAVEKNELVWADETFETVTTLCTVADVGNDQGFSVTNNGTESIGVYNPIRTRPRIVPSTDGTRIYLTDVHDLKIQVIDLDQKKIVQTIQHKVKRIPFDEDWAEAKFKENTEGRHSASTKWTKIYPEQFPAIRSLTLAPDGNLIVDRWRGKPDDTNWFLTLTPKGEVVKKEWNGERLKRQVGVHGEFAYVTYWDTEAEEAAVARVPRGKVDAWIAAHPVEYDGPTGRTMSFDH